MEKDARNIKMVHRKVEKSKMAYYKMCFYLFYSKFCLKVILV